MFLGCLIFYAPTVIATISIMLITLTLSSFSKDERVLNFYPLIPILFPAVLYILIFERD
jgi:hypothetical protein